jgi:chromosome segregation ATPase
VRPLEEEHQLQHLDEIPMDKLRPEFRAGLDKLTKYILDRAGPKQLGSITLTGPMFASLTQSFLDAINSGAVPTIANSWQSVEESECRRAYELAVKTYSEDFDKTIPPEEALLQEAHEEAFQTALNTFNIEAVGGGTLRKKYEKELYNTVKKQFESHKRKLLMEAELQCLRAAGSLEERTLNACHAPNASFESVVKVIDGLVAEYEVSAVGSFKWQKLVKFLRNSLAGPLEDLVKREKDTIRAEYSALELQNKSMEEKFAFGHKQVESAQKDAQDWKKRYESSINDAKKSSESAATQHAIMQKRITTLEERHTTITSQMDEIKKEASEWRSKYEQLLNEHRMEHERSAAENKLVLNRCTISETRLAAMREQLEASKEEATEWRHKYETVEADTKAAIERANVSKDRALKQAQLREDALRADFAAAVALKDGEIKDLHSKFERGERQIAILSSRLHEQEVKLTGQIEELTTLKTELRHSHAELETKSSTIVTLQKDLETACQDKVHAEQRMAEAMKRMEEAERLWKIAEKREKYASEAVEKARNELSATQREKSESQRLASERLTAIERSERRCDSLERERFELTQTLEHVKISEQDALSRITALELRIEEREREMEKLLDASNEQRLKTVESFEALLDSERAAKMEASSRADKLSAQLTIVQGDLDALQTQLMSVRNHETALDTKLKSYTDVSTISPSEHTVRTKRMRIEKTSEVGDMEVDKHNLQSLMRGMTHNISRREENHEGHNSNEDMNDNNTSMTTEDYHKFTVAKLKQKLTQAGHGEEVAQLKSSATKRDIIALYEKLMFPN